MARYGLVVAAAAVLAGSGVVTMARADLYLAGSLGAEFVRDADLTFNDGSGKVDALTYDVGAGGNVAIGLALGRIRVEAEGFYRRSSLGDMTLTAPGGSAFLNAEGSQTAYGVMGNIWYDFYTGSGWVPFIGAGFGYAKVNLKIDNLIDPTTGLALPQGFDESDWVYAYQVGAGLGYQFSPWTTLTLTYRYFGTESLDFMGYGVPQEFEYASHNFQIGLRYRF